MERNHPPRKKGDVLDPNNPSQMSHFVATQQSYRLCNLTRDRPANNQTSQTSSHVRLRDRLADENPALVEFEWDECTTAH